MTAVFHEAALLPARQRGVPSPLPLPPIPGARVVVAEAGGFNRAVMAFTRAVKKAGVIEEARRRQHYEPPSSRRRRRKRQAARRQSEGRAGA